MSSRSSMLASMSCHAKSLFDCPRLFASAASFCSISGGQRNRKHSTSWIEFNIRTCFGQVILRSGPEISASNVIASGALCATNPRVPACVKTLEGIGAPQILRLVVTRRAKKRRNSFSAREYDQIRAIVPHLTKIISHRNFLLSQGGSHVSQTTQAGSATYRCGV
jgi:hypothetical protein